MLESTRGDLNALEELLLRLDGRGYRAYREIEGGWQAEGFVLFVDHVQGDPFATPSRLRIAMPPQEHGVPAEAYGERPRRIGTCDFLLRAFADATARIRRTPGIGHSGRVLVDSGGAEILERSGCSLNDDGLELRFRVGLPAQGRRILGRAAARLLCGSVAAAAETVRWSVLDSERATEWADLAEDHRALQQRLHEEGLIAFVADGSILPRRSGVSAEPLAGAVPFRSPESLRIRLTTRRHGPIEGLGLPVGITLITGGGFHGKSTLLDALQAGIYPHVPGDGREWVVTRDDAVKLRSEDGRAIRAVDLRPFIRDLPGEKPSHPFETQNASGSTSLAASIVEQMEAGSRCLLFDEDTCATNMLIRDDRMQALVRRETIVPLIDRILQLRDDAGVSAVMVIGGSGGYLDVSDRVLLMEEYLPLDVSDRARKVAREFPVRREPSTEPVAPLDGARRLDPRSLDARRGGRTKIRARDTRELRFGEETLDLAALEQLVDPSQVRALGLALRLVARCDHPLSIGELLEHVRDAFERDGLAGLDDSPELAAPRMLELAAAINRMRLADIRPG